MNLAAMVDEISRAMSANVSRALAPLTRQVEDLLAWRKAVGELRDGKDGAHGLKGEPGIDGKDGSDGVAGKDGAHGLAGKDGAHGINGEDGAAGIDGKDGAPGASGKDGTNGIDGKDGKDGIRGADGKDGAPGRDAPPVDLDAVVAKVLPLIRTPKDGRDGRDGADGAKGLDGKHGSDGERGEKGTDGRDGTNGNGIKRFDYEEKSNTLDIIMDGDEQFSLRLPEPKRGEKGDAGANGKDGANGRDGKDGADGLHGKDGAAGIHGKDGSNGLDGKNGLDGQIGPRGEKGDAPSIEELTSIVSKACDAVLPGLVEKHAESLMSEIITRASLLVPAGRDGLPGRPGTPGEDGKPGVGIESVELDFAGKRTGTLILRMSDGGRQEMPVNIGPVLRDAGVHRPGAGYEEGDCVTHGGSYWVAKCDTSAAPGKSDDWRMVVKRGRDGRDHTGVDE